MKVTVAKEDYTKKIYDDDSGCITCTVKPNSVEQEQGNCEIKTIKKNTFIHGNSSESKGKEYSTQPMSSDSQLEISESERT